MKTPILETERLILRPLCYDDANEVLACWQNDPDVAEYMLWESHNDINKTKEWLESEITKINIDSWYRWVFVEKEKQALIGTGVIYFDEEHEMFEIAYNLGKKFWGCGYTVEAMKTIIDFSINKLEIKEIIGHCAKVNSSSSHVMKKLGFVFNKNCPYQCYEDKPPLLGEEYILIVRD